ncbi:hypothetical protein SI65_01454 [Aspergillus cristatus]|uniref:Uncharacterized protein n=1 Tax=Aspergillus cristatus TaxID=573508 RepID=A0A1E3BSB7_ASPCR|nr:hypothetical protein SI65_01454 [Aspergillus cristatus]
MAESDALRMAARTKQDLNSYQVKQGLGPKSDSTLESGVDEFVDKKFPQETGVRTGRVAGPTGSDKKPIPEDEGGSRDDRGRLAPAGEFQGEGGPEDKARIQWERRPGDDDTLNLQDLKRKGIAK